MTDLLNKDSLLPISEVAPLIRRTTGSAINLAQRGRLAAVRDAGGRWWSSKDAADWFMAGKLPEDYAAGGAQ